jgi:hypothetical protein
MFLSFLAKKGVEINKLFIFDLIFQFLALNSLYFLSNLMVLTYTSIFIFFKSLSVLVLIHILLYKLCEKLLF